MVLALATCLAVAAAPFWPPAAGLIAAVVRGIVPVEQTLVQKGRVVVCDGNADLDVMGRIGALLRF